MKYVLYNLWMTAQILDVIASLLSAWYLIKLRQRFGYYIGAVFVAIAIESIIAATSLYLFWNEDIRISAGFAIARIVGRLLKAAALWVMVLYCLGYLNGVDKNGAK